MCMSLEKYMAETSTATVVKVEIAPIRDVIDEKYWKEWSQYDVEGNTPKLDRDHYHITYSDEGYERTEYFVVPVNKRGFNKSGIRDVIHKNPENGADPMLWVGKAVLIEFDANGYSKISR